MSSPEKPPTKNHVSIMVFLDEKVEDILGQTCTWRMLSESKRGIDPLILSDDEASRAYLRGAYQMAV